MSNKKGNNAMNMPAFTAETSLYATNGHYRAGSRAFPSPNQIFPAIPRCDNCESILERCENNGWRPRAVCNACLFGNCYDEPPLPDPYPDPFGSLPRF